MLAHFNHGGFLFDESGEALVAKLRALVVPNGFGQATGKSELAATEPGCAHGRPACISRSRLLKRVQIDLEHCPTCCGQIKTKIKIIDAILEATLIERTLTRLGPQARAPVRGYFGPAA